MSEKLLKPGMKNRPAGTYEEVGPRGGHFKDAKVVNITKGDKMPPTSKAGNNWKLK